MTVTEQIITILVVAFATQLTRWVPFWAFRSSAHTPLFVNYLGRVLPHYIRHVGGLLLQGRGFSNALIRYFGNYIGYMCDNHPNAL